MSELKTKKNGKVQENDGVLEKSTNLVQKLGFSGVFQRNVLRIERKTLKSTKKCRETRENDFFREFHGFFSFPKFSRENIEKNCEKSWKTVENTKKKLQKHEISMDKSKNLIFWKLLGNCGFYTVFRSFSRYFTRFLIWNEHSLPESYKNNTKLQEIQRKW